MLPNTHIHTHPCTPTHVHMVHLLKPMNCIHHGGYDIIMHQGKPWLLLCGGRDRGYVYIGECEVEKEGRLKA